MAKAPLAKADRHPGRFHRAQNSVFPYGVLIAGADYLALGKAAVHGRRVIGAVFGSNVSESLAKGVESESAADERLEADEREVAIVPAPNAMAGYAGNAIFEILEVGEHGPPFHKPLAADVVDLLRSTALFANAIAQLDDADPNRPNERTCYDALAAIKSNLRRIAWSRGLE